MTAEELRRALEKAHTENMNLRVALETTKITLQNVIWVIDFVLKAKKEEEKP
jgi:hypothetical protein